MFPLAPEAVEVQAKLAPVGFEFKLNRIAVPEQVVSLLVEIEAVGSGWTFTLLCFKADEHPANLDITEYVTL